MHIIQIKNNNYNPVLRELFTEYLEWVLSKCEVEFNVDYDVKNFASVGVNKSLEEINKFFPPSGCLFLCKNENEIVGTACMRKIVEKIGEIKRMYVRPKFRGMGIGRTLLEQLIDEARDFGYSKLRLDTGPFMKEAQGLYYSFGFRNIEPYPESEVLGENIPKEISENWIFMEMDLK
ncbi:MAG: GNAT family N-acetyltransferase [Promethearchaeota archaeon]|jgi:GNAT superfamily N-acetyltransferase